MNSALPHLRRILKIAAVGLMFLLAPALPSFGEAKQTIVNPSSPRMADYPKIVIFTVAWCPHCRELKEYLTSHNIPFINRDVELDPSAMELLTTRYGTFGVPVVVIGNDQEILKGFSPADFEKAVQKVRTGSK